MAESRYAQRLDLAAAATLPALADSPRLARDQQPLIRTDRDTARAPRHRPARLTGRRPAHARRRRHPDRPAGRGLSRPLRPLLGLSKEFMSRDQPHRRRREQRGSDPAARERTVMADNPAIRRFSIRPLAPRYPRSPTPLASPATSSRQSDLTGIWLKRLATYLLAWPHAIPHTRGRRHPDCSAGRGLSRPMRPLLRLIANFMSRD